MSLLDSKDLGSGQKSFNRRSASSEDQKSAHENSQGPRTVVPFAAKAVARRAPRARSKKATTGRAIRTRASRTQPLGEASSIRRIGLLNDYVRVPYANGSSFASQFLYREFEAQGRAVTVVGPDDPEASVADLPENHLLLPSLPLRSAPGVRLALPGPTALRALEDKRFDVILGQTSNALMDVGVWLRARQGIPLVMVNTLHLPTAYNALLPSALEGASWVRGLFERHLVPLAERHTVDAYNQGDGLIVLSSGLKKYWRQRGVRVPIHVIPRAIEPKVFDRPAGKDPFDPRAKKGDRLLVVCRHVREKSVDRLLRIFAHHVLPLRPHASLTLAGDGPEHEAYRRLATELGVADRVFFVGEQPLPSMASWYGHADLFVYASLSETYGQVITEALWCGLPVVAFADGMGVSDQIVSGQDGVLVDPAHPRAEERFGDEVCALLANRHRRKRTQAEARRRARARVSPEKVLAAYENAMMVAQAHCRRAMGGRGVGESLHGVRHGRPLRSLRRTASLSGGPSARDGHASRERARDERIRSVPLREKRVLGRWAGMQALAFALGMLRRPPRTAKAQQTTWALAPLSKPSSGRGL